MHFAVWFCTVPAVSSKRRNTSRMTHRTLLSTGGAPKSEPPSLRALCDNAVHSSGPARLRSLSNRALRSGVSHVTQRAASVRCRKLGVKLCASAHGARSTQLEYKLAGWAPWLAASASWQPTAAGLPHRRAGTAIRQLYWSTSGYPASAGSRRLSSLVSPEARYTA